MSKHQTVGIEFRRQLEEVSSHIQHEMESRAWRGALELRNSALLVLRGQRNGRRYKVPGTYRRQRDKTDGKMKNGRYYTASAPGEPPAIRTGAFRTSWQAKSRVVYGDYVSRIETDLRTDSGHNLGEILENGTSRMAPRPHHDRILEDAEDKIYKIYSENYF